MHLLELSKLKKKFGQLVAVNDISLVVEEGELRGLIGPNGSGKTTLFGLITGFIRPTEGRVLWQNNEITHHPPERIAEKGLVRTFQHSALFKEMNVLQNVTMACHLHTDMGAFDILFKTPRSREKQKRIEEMAMGLLEVVGLADTKDEIAGDLPHGMQRALGIAMALATEPKMLLLDEPVAGMNPVETESMMERIRALRERGITILLVEHDMKAVMTTCEKITVMNFGKKIAEGPPEEISRNEDVIEAYLGGV